MPGGLDFTRAELFVVALKLFCFIVIVLVELALLERPDLPDLPGLLPLALLGPLRYVFFRDAAFVGSRFGA